MIRMTSSYHAPNLGAMEAERNERRRASAAAAPGPASGLTLPPTFFHAMRGRHQPGPRARRRQPGPRPAGSAARSLPAPRPPSPPDVTPHPTPRHDPAPKQRQPNAARTGRRGRGGDGAEHRRSAARHAVDARRRGAGRWWRDYGYEGTIALLWEGFAGDGPDARRHAGRARRGAAGGVCRACPAGCDAAPRRPMDAAVRRCLAELPDDSAPAAIVAALSVGVPALLRAAPGPGAGAARRRAAAPRRTCCA